ncbi:hypothetical protein AYK26_05305 [Euryarchaeota archaeon SM23-78]|nr:MAG: hypothetical protein AYK26_05305 [Euryarchaeota archaeon SM23-78]MBW3001335.1 S-adenosylmethionine decarboxylase [Candidatus Woesearchaeota archaeon]
MKKDKPFGYSLLIDMYDCENANDLALGYFVLDNLPAVIGMAKQGPPIVIRGQEYLKKEGSEKGGISGWIALIESGIQLHTIREKKFVSIDIYTCKEFDQKVAIEFCKKHYSPKKVEVNFLIRGKEYGKIN